MKFDFSRSNHGAIWAANVVWCTQIQYHEALGTQALHNMNTKPEALRRQAFHVSASWRRQTLSRGGSCPSHPLSHVSNFDCPTFHLPSSSFRSPSLVLCLAASAMCSTCLSLGVEVCGGVRSMNSCISLSVACVSLFCWTMFLNSWLGSRRNIFCSDLCYSSYMFQNRGKSRLRQAPPQHMHFVTPSSSKTRVVCQCWISFTSTSNSPA